MKRSYRSYILLILLSLSLLSPLNAHAEKDPNQVSIEYIIQSIYGINTIQQTFEADFYLYMNWRQEGIRCSVDTDWKTTWKPEIEFINSLEKLDARKDGFECYQADDDGNSDSFSYWGRYQGTFQASMNFERFPFDQHELSIDIESYAHNSDELVFVYDEDNNGLRDGYSLCNGKQDCLSKNVLLEDPPLSEWSMGRIGVRKSLTDYSATEGEGVSYSKISLEIELQRLYQHYLWKILLPVVLLILFSLMIFRTEPTDFMGRLGAAITLFLSILALSFITKEILPPVPYIVLADAYMLAAYIMIFATAIESAAVYRIVNMAGDDSGLRRAKRLDRLCLWSFPAVYIFFGIYVYLTTGT
jgi:hypothetical protein